jgi:hypothetical protein
MKKLKKSTGLTVALLIYVSATAAYFLPRNTEISNTEKYVTVIASYVIVLALWLGCCAKKRSCSVSAVKKIK